MSPYPCWTPLQADFPVIRLFIDKKHMGCTTFGECLRGNKQETTHFLGGAPVLRQTHIYIYIYSYIVHILARIHEMLPNHLIVISGPHSIGVLTIDGCTSFNGMHGTIAPFCKVDFLPPPPPPPHVLPGLGVASV